MLSQQTEETAHKWSYHREKNGVDILFGFPHKQLNKKKLSEEDKIEIALRERELCNGNHDWITYDKTRKWVLKYK